jgi:hypothetical protein
MSPELLLPRLRPVSTARSGGIIGGEFARHLSDGSKERHPDWNCVLDLARSVTF